MLVWCAHVLPVRRATGSKAEASLSGRNCRRLLRATVGGADFDRPWSRTSRDVVAVHAGVLATARPQGPQEPETEVEPDVPVQGDHRYGQPLAPVECDPVHSTHPGRRSRRGRCPHPGWCRAVRKDTPDSRGLCPRALGPLPTDGHGLFVRAARATCMCLCGAPIFLVSKRVS